VVDDFALPLGATRLRLEGSDGGHNGLVSIIEVLGTQQFARLRLGIGPVPPGASVVNFVLNRFSDEERKEIDKTVDFAAQACIFALDNRLETAMSKYNRNPALPENS
jgi:PTH1 family peptidyl-tRNA hydrolase